MTSRLGARRRGARRRASLADRLRARRRTASAQRRPRRRRRRPADHRSAALRRQDHDQRAGRQPATRENGQTIAEALMDSVDARPTPTPRRGWRRSAPSTRIVDAGRQLRRWSASGQGATVRRRSPSDDVAIWQRETLKLVVDGLERLPQRRPSSAAPSRVSCDMCHPDAANTHPETYPKFQVAARTRRAAARHDQLVHRAPGARQAARPGRSRTCARSRPTSTRSARARRSTTAAAEEIHRGDAEKRRISAPPRLRAGSLPSTGLRRDDGEAAVRRVEQREEGQQLEAAAFDGEVVGENHVAQPGLPVTRRRKKSCVSRTVTSARRVRARAPVVVQDARSRASATWVSPRSVKTKLIVIVLPSAFGPFSRVAIAVKKCVERQSRAAARWRRPGSTATRCDAVAQLVGAGEIDVAPRARFRLVAELIVGAREQLARRGIVGLGEDQVVEQRRGPAVVAVVVGALRLCAAPRRRRPSPRRSASPPPPAAADRGWPGCRRTSRSRPGTPPWRCGARVP